MVETHKKRKNTVITEITLTISNAEHIKQTLSTSKHDPHQQHLPKISQNVSGAVPMAIQYGRNTYRYCSITAMLKLLNNFIRTRLTVKSRDCNTLLGKAHISNP